MRRPRSESTPARSDATPRRGSFCIPDRPATDAAVATRSPDPIAEKAAGWYVARFGTWPLVSRSLSQHRDAWARRSLVAIIRSRVLNWAIQRCGPEAVFFREPQKSFAHLSVGAIVRETAASPRLLQQIKRPRHRIHSRPRRES